MKIRIVVLLTLMSISISGMSQAMWIMIFGDKLSTERMQSGVSISVAGINLMGLDDARPALNWAIGGFSDIRISKKNLFFAFDFTMKSPLGAGNLNSYFSDIIPDTSIIKSQNIILNNVAMSLPLYLKYKTKYIGFGLGPQMSYIYKSTLRYKAETSNGRSILVKDSGKEFIHHFDIGAFAMAEVYLTPSNPKTSMRIGIRYYFGLLEPLKNFSGIHNSTLMVSFGIPIGGKSKIKTE